MKIRFGRILAQVALAGLASACGESTTDPKPAAVDLDALFAPPTAAEIQSVRDDWARRTPRAEGVRVEAEVPFELGGGAASARVYSHIVDGFRHHGLVVIPTGAPAGSLSIVTFAHPGDAGVGLAEVALYLSLLGDRGRDFVTVVPSFRSETLDIGIATFTSGGTPSPWDRDVDDALALVEVVAAEVEEADPTRRAVIGFSRGALVALLMGIRDPATDAVVEFAGPTDFFDDYVRDIITDAVEGRLVELPGVSDLDEQFIQPLANGSLSTAQVRIELVRRSAVLFVDDLPPVQVHHGTADDVVGVSQAESLEDALRAAGRDDEVFRYPGAGHNPLEMSGSVQRTVAFLERWLSASGSRTSADRTCGRNAKPPTAKCRIPSRLHRRFPTAVDAGAAAE